MNPHCVRLTSTTRPPEIARVGATQCLATERAVSRRDFKDHWKFQVNISRHILNGVNRAGGRMMKIHSLTNTAAVSDELWSIECIPIPHWFTGTINRLN